MLRVNLSKSPAAERRELLVLGAGSPVIAGLLYWIFGGAIVPTVLMLLSFLALAGRLFYRFIGRDVYLVFAVIGAGLGRLVSATMLIFMYVFVVGIMGSLLKLLGMNHLNRDFRQCKKRESMFVDAPVTNAENLRRQS